MTLYRWRFVIKLEKQCTIQSTLYSTNTLYYNILISNILILSLNHVHYKAEYLILTTI